LDAQAFFQSANFAVVAISVTSPVKKERELRRAAGSWFRAPPQAFF